MVKIKGVLNAENSECIRNGKKTIKLHKIKIVVFLT